MKQLALMIACASFAACGGSDPTYKVGGQVLTVKDSGYVTGDYFCEAAAMGQLRVVFVDYFPICAPNDPIDSQRDITTEHNELELIYVTAQVKDAKTPVPVAVGDCTNGPAGPGIATFRHFAANSTTPVETQAVGGQLFLTQLDPTGDKPAKGSFDLDFGQQGAISGSFSSYTCN